jgi:hypothetical protein
MGSRDATSDQEDRGGASRVRALGGLGATMARVNFRLVQHRFTHIDAEFVSCVLGFSGIEPYYRVRLYPWWEHPAVVEATRAGKPWAFKQPCEGAVKEVTVLPRGLHTFRISAGPEVIDWAFLKSHPLLWPFEDQGEIICNSDVAMPELIERICKADLPHADKATIYQYVDPLLPYSSPFSLGRLPLPLFLAVRHALQSMGVRTYVFQEPQPKETPVLLLIDSADYIIADDFELDVPEFVHDPAWLE